MRGSSLPAPPGLVEVDSWFVCQAIKSSTLHAPHPNYPNLASDDEAAPEEGEASNPPGEESAPSNAGEEGASYPAADPAAEGSESTEPASLSVRD